MKFSSRKAGDVVVFDLKGNLEGGPDTYKLKEAVKEKLDAGDRKFLLNMNGVDYVNSTGVGIAVSVYSSIVNASGVMKICNTQERVSRIMMVTKLLEVFESYYSEDEALKSFQSA